jgi:hypothetical protein
MNIFMKMNSLPFLKKHVIQIEIQNHFYCELIFLEMILRVTKNSKIFLIFKNGTMGP